MSIKIKTDLELTLMTELVDKDIKIVITLFYVIKKLENERVM